MVSAEAIEKALYERFITGGKLLPYEIGSQLHCISRPAVNFAVIGGTFEDPGNRSSTIMQVFQITTKVVTKNIRSDGESHRRAEAHPLILWIMQKLWLNTLGLDIKPIALRSWNETTSLEQLQAGIFEAEINATCKAGMQRLDESAMDELLTSIFSGYTLPDSSDPDRVILESQINLQETP